jgi:hypothetical protein
MASGEADHVPGLFSLSLRSKPLDGPSAALILLRS